MHLGRASLLLSVLLSLAQTALGQEAVPNQERRELYTREAKETVEGGLRWLAAQQIKEGKSKGAWKSWVGFKINDAYRKQPPRAQQGEGGSAHLGVTALAGMAFLSGGHLPGQGPYGEIVTNALDFVLKHVGETGFIRANGTRMYSHAFSVLFLAEIYGMTGRADLRERLDRAIEFTYKSQNEKGGWRYSPGARDSDMSITVCQVVALREARNIGIKVPKKTIAKALRYVMESAVTFGSDDGAFLYQHREVPFNRNSFALTAAGLTTIYQAGLYSDREVKRFCQLNKISTIPKISNCLKYLTHSYDPVWRDYRKHYFYYYGNYYAAQAMYTRGGDDWRNWYTMVRDDLLNLAQETKTKQGRGFSWQSHFVGDAFATAVACVILQVPTHYLPIFQR